MKAYFIIDQYIALFLSVFSFVTILREYKNKNIELIVKVNDAVDTKNINHLVFKASGEIERNVRHRPAIKAG